VTRVELLGKVPTPAMTSEGLIKVTCGEVCQNKKSESFMAELLFARISWPFFHLRNQKYQS
jgi:hypothetical protein